MRFAKCGLIRVLPLKRNSPGSNSPLSSRRPLVPHLCSASCHDPRIAADSPEQLLDRVVETSVTKAIFGGNEPARRAFLKQVGAGTAAAVVGSVFPLSAAKALAQDAA